MTEQTTPLSMVLPFLAVAMLVASPALAQTSSPDLVFQVQGLT